MYERIDQSSNQPTQTPNPIPPTPTPSQKQQGVMLAAFGRPAQVLTTLMIFIITFLTPVAYLVRASAGALFPVLLIVCCCACYAMPCCAMLC